MIPSIFWLEIVMVETLLVLVPDPNVSGLNEEKGGWHRLSSVLGLELDLQELRFL